MIKRNVKLFVFLVLVSLLVVPGFGEQPVKEKIDELMAAYSKYDLFAGTVLAAKDGKIIYTGAFGDANKDHKVANKLETRYNIGSIGKTFTATSIMQLAQKGKLKVSDPLSKFLPDFPFPEKDTITLHHLLNHTSGLTNYMGHKDYEAKAPGLRKISDALALIYDQKPQFPAGEKFRYSNSGMVVLGAVIEKVTGITYAEYIKQNIFEPLGMNESGIVYREQVVPNRSTGYIKNGSGTYTNNIFMEPPAFSDGGLYTTVGDMLKFDQALYGDKLLSEEHKTKMFTPNGPTDGYAYGWSTAVIEGHRLIGHGGGAPGINAIFNRFIDDKYTIIVLSNYDGAAVPVSRAIEAILFGRAYNVPTRADAVFQLGFSLEMRGKLREAVTVFSENLTGENPHLPTLYQSARSKIVGKFEQEKAIAELDRYIKLAKKDTQPSAAAAYWRKGVAFEQLGKIEEAIRCHETSLKLDPKFPQAKQDLDRLKKKKK